MEQWLGYFATFTPGLRVDKIYRAAHKPVLARLPHLDNSNATSWLRNRHTVCSGVGSSTDAKGRVSHVWMLSGAPHGLRRLLVRVMYRVYASLGLWLYTSQPNERISRTTEKCENDRVRATPRP